MKPHGQRHEAWPKDKDTKEESEAHQAVQNSTHRRYIPGPATFVVSCEMAPSLLVLNWCYLSVGLTITSWTDVSMAVISPLRVVQLDTLEPQQLGQIEGIQGCPANNIWNRKFSLLCQMTKCLF